MWMGLPFFAYTSCAQPTAQNGQMLVPTRSACSTRGRSVREVWLDAASAITFWPANCRGNDESSNKRGTRSGRRRRMRFMGRSPRPFLTLSGDSAHRNAALLLKFLSELYRTGDGMLSIVGMMVIAQEERFHLLDRN